MIGYLSGTIKYKELENLILDVQGVGYRVHVPLFVWQGSSLGEKKELFIYTHVKDDAIALYGFGSQADQEIFLKLISVSGIGPRTALNILSYAQGALNIIKAISEADVDYFQEVKGLGKKGSQRIIVDLKSKIGGLKELEFEGEADTDLMEAMKGLGYVKDEIRKVIKGIDQNLPLEEKIKLALRKTGD